LPENYAELAKKVYKMAEKEGWSQQKIFELLKDPSKLVKTMEHVRYLPATFVFSNMARIYLQIHIKLTVYL
jgi:ribosome-binding protein aMBF1 (putative translation factor)